VFKTVAESDLGGVCVVSKSLLTHDLFSKF